MDTDRAHISEVLAKANAYGIEHVQLSHALIMDIDEINDEDNTRALLLQDIAQEAHSYGMEVWVWAHEFYGDRFTICFDPEDPIWEERAQAYREALTLVPEIDGVILMFGSADTEPWYAPCFCKWCRQQEPTGNPILDIINSRPADRLRQIYKTVGSVVMDEYQKKLRVRTFMHFFPEIWWLGDSLKNYDDGRLMVMSKDVPQDWVPYYPHNPLIGNVGDRHQIVEMDLGNEYWGKSKILNGQVDYVYYRWSHDRAVGARGAAARIERGSDSALGNPNEINVHAFSRIIKEGAAPDDVYREWFEQEYGILPQTPASDTLKEIFRNSHFAMRKMYYTLGMWTLEKGSGVPDSARFPEQLWLRSTAFYDPAWLPLFFSLVLPTEQTLMDLWQEGAESIRIAQNNLDALETIEGDFSKSADYDELHDMLELQRDCSEIWQLVDDVVYRYINYLFGHPDNKPILEYDARRLLELADEMEARWGANVSPGKPDDIRDFVADLRKGFADQPTAVPWEQTELYDINATSLGGGTWEIEWTSSETATSRVEWSDELPVYDFDSGELESLSTSHSVQITLSEPGQRTVYRVCGHDAQGNLVRSGDFWLNLDP